MRVAHALQSHPGMGMPSTRLCLLLAIPLAACGAEQSDSPGGDDGADDPAPVDTGGAAERAIAEADIIQVDGDTLYAMSESGTLSIIDLATPGQLRMLGQSQLPGRPFEMYRRGDYLVTMNNAAVDGAGNILDGTSTPEDAGALVLAVDVRNPGAITTGAMYGVPGDIADSRIVGDVLYLATYENAQCYQCGPAPRTMVTSFNVRDALAMREIDQVSFESNAPDGYNLPWGQNWKRSIVVTDERLYVGGHADLDPSQLGTTAEGIIDVLDISDPFGDLREGARITVAGAILSRWQVDEEDGVLRVISQIGAGRTGNGLAYPEVETFRIDSTRQFTPLGRMTLQLPYQEGLRTVRFDGDRAYAITYYQTDPMFIIDLADPARPQQRGELYMPGFMYHLEPRGDRVIGLGIDRTDPLGNLNVSLFDVSNPDAPTLLSRASFGTVGITEDYAILNGSVAEDQDRIQKAFRVLDDGVVVVPFSAPQPYWATGTDLCANTGGGVQLVEWSGDTLVRRALLPIPGNPRRAFEHRDHLLTVSDSNVRAFSLAQLDVAQPTGDLVIGTCVPRDSSGYGDGGWGGGEDWDEGGYGDDVYYGCASASRGGSSAATLLLIGLAVVMVRRRRRQG